MFFKNTFLYTVIIWVRFGVYAQGEEARKNETQFTTPEYILPCYKSDPNLNKCLQGTFNHLRPYLVNGLTDINVPSIDPFKLDKIVIENGQGPLKVKASFYNVTAQGAQNYTVEKINANVDDYIIEIGFKFPRMDIRGKYDVNGNVLLFPVRSKGDFWAIFLDIEAAAKIYGVEFIRDNVRYMRVEKMLVDFKLKKSRFRIRDIINHSNIIGEAMNNFLNNNSEEIIREMKPAARLSIARHFKGFLNSAFMQLPLKIWLPDA
ncbi:circadian clock-controlled protein daywake-like [Anthonomus grandis grandis]|uniref:circadian clock-controlled protein daywake-like n=1 Tax=Anthonomus grandis grandis TaxID=2921223 RepID=UPI0021659C7C|nr:circadian clock-controlled protein daywake-like [Anthonomus grandis grandis]